MTAAAETVLAHFPRLCAGAASDSPDLEVVAPYDGAPIATVATADSVAVEASLATAHALFRDRDAWLSPSRRTEILERAATIMHERAEALAIEAAREGGKPLVDSRVEVARAIDGVKLCVEALRTQAGVEIPMNLNAASANRLAFTSFEPIGVVVAVSAFNHPLNLIVHQVGPAVAAGCPFIVKPANLTPLSCLRFVQILREAGLPDEWGQVAVTSGRDVAEMLVTDPRVAFFSFIGSPGVGWALRSKLAPGTRCALEHGGAAPVLVAADADPDEVLPLLVKGGFYHAGQVCVSVQRMFVQESVAREVAERMADQAKALVIGDPTVAATEVGPLIRPAEVDRVAQWVDQAREGGAETLLAAVRKSPIRATRRRSCMTRPPRPTSASRRSLGPRCASIPTAISTKPSPVPMHCPSPSTQRCVRATSTPRCAPTAGSTPAP